MAKTNWLLVGGIAVVAYLLLVGNPFAAEESTEADGVTTTTEVVCESSTTPDLDINTYDIENPNTALTETVNLQRKVGSTAWNTFTAGTAITNVVVGEKYEILLGAATTNSTDNAYGQYFVTEPIGCKELIELDVGVYNDEIETSITATWYNKNHDASGENYTAGQIKNSYLLFEAGSDEVFGNPFIAESGLADNSKHSVEYPNVICMDLNSTTHDTPDKVMYGSVEMDSVSQPQRHSAVAGKNTYCYEAPVITDEGQELTVKFDADDSNAVVADETAYLYAGTFYITKAGNVAWGVEDEEGKNIGTDAADQLTLDFTP